MIGMIAGWLEDAIVSVPEGSRTIVAIQVRPETPLPSLPLRTLAR